MAVRRGMVARLQYLQAGLQIGGGVGLGAKAGLASSSTRRSACSMGTSRRARSMSGCMASQAQSMASSGDLGSMVSMRM